MIMVSFFNEFIFRKLFLLKHYLVLQYFRTGFAYLQEILTLKEHGSSFFDTVVGSEC
jgi:hypothetical protein